MNWSNHPMLYQLPHWWHWLAYGQNAAVVAALGTVLAASAATAAGIFAARAYRATLVQLRIARKQLALARAQFHTERSRFEEERRRALRAAKALFERMRSEEESTRPRFRITNGYQLQGGLQNWEFQNCGTGAATEVSVSNSDETELQATESIVGSGSLIRLRTTPQALASDGILFRFKTEFGSRWQLIVRLDGTEEIRSGTRNYEPDEGGASH